MTRRPLFLSVLLLPLACASTPGVHTQRYDVGRWAAPPLERVVSVRDGRSGRNVSFDALLDTLAKADVVFLGETHTDETTHRVELAVYEGLLERRAGRVVLAMEMFERDVQGTLDDYLRGTIDEETFLSHARPWSNYRTAYRPLIERARAAGRPVVASNFPRPLLVKVARQGRAALDGDSAGDAPKTLFPNTPAYWRRVDNAVRSHRAMMGGRMNDDDQRLYSTQTLWDNAMGEACAVALDRHPGNLVLHVNGGFHSAYWDGTVRQLGLRKPGARIETVAIEPVALPSAAELEGRPASDYVVFVEARAADPQDGAWSVYVQREMEYAFHLPASAETAGRVPLLIWLSDDGLAAEDGLDLWKDRLGEEAAIAVLEAPYRETGEDLSGGGRWYWSDSFSSDIGAMRTAVERAWGYLLRHYPIDPDRVCLAGEGTGGTVAASVALFTNRMDVRAVALSPRRYAKIKDFSLPLPEFRGDGPHNRKSLHVVVNERDRDWWMEELREYTEVEFDNAMTVATDDPWRTELERENALRSALGLDVRRPGETGAGGRYVLLHGDSPRERHWARLLALRVSADGTGPVAVVGEPPADAASDGIDTHVSPDVFAAGAALPRCPGPFGGSTIVVLPEDVTPGDTEAWLAIEKDDPLKKQNRFRRLRIATSTGERSLPSVLERLIAANRKNVLIVPAVFCADAATMRELRQRIRGLEDRLTLHWLPGLGGALAAKADPR